MLGAPRLTAHGSGGEALTGGAATPDVGLGVAGAVIDAVDVVACGVLATVESPEPQPVNVAATNTSAVRGSARRASDHTSRNRTEIRSADAAGSAARRTSGARSPLDFMHDDAPGQLA
jgi:hypothetical protein